MADTQTPDADAPDNDELEVLASAILDGHVVDWNGAPADHGLSAELRELQTILRFHHELAADPVTWGHLRIIRRLGAGAFGEVFLATDPRLDRAVALKLLYDAWPAALEGDDVVHEARLLARVHHPNVVTVFGAERRGGRVGIWTEFVEGQTLASILENRGPLPVTEAIAVALQLCDALSAIHAAGLVHGDVKAQNVLRDQSGRVVLVDLGTGRERVSVARSTSGPPAGTPLYLAPELWRGEHATAASDIYSLAVLLYYLLTGGFPVFGRTAEDVRVSHERSKRVTLGRVRPDLPRPLTAVIDRALDPHSWKRWPSAAALKTALVSADASRQRTRRSALLLAGFAAAIALLTTGVYARRSTALGHGWRGVPDVTPPQTIQLTASNSSEGGISAAAVAPDGRQFVYANPEGVFVQAWGGDTPRRLAWDPPVEVTDIAWIPQSNTIIVAAGNTLWRTSLAATTADKLVDDVVKASVSPDGQRIAFQRTGGGLWIANRDGTGVRPLEPPQEQITFAKASWSPDGTRLAYIKYDWAHPERRVSLCTIRPDGTDSTIVFTPPHSGGMHQVIWAPDGRLLFTRPLPPPLARDTHLWQIAIDTRSGLPTGEPVQVTDYPDFNFVNASITDDGSKLVFVRNRHLFEVRAATFDEAGNRLGPPERAAWMTSELLPLSWTRDGALLFRAAPLGTIYVQAPGSVAPAEFFHDPDRAAEDAAVTADGRYALYIGSEERVPSVLRGTPHENQTTSLFHLSGADASLRCARASARVCAAAVRDHVHNVLTVTPFDPVTGAVASPIAVSPVISVQSWDLAPDGSAIAVEPSAGPPRIHTVNLETRQAHDIATNPWRGFGVSWFSDGTGWLITTARGQGGDVVAIRDGSPARALWSSDWERLSLPLISLDGRRAAFLGLRVESNVWMLRHF